MRIALGKERAGVSLDAIRMDGALRWGEAAAGRDTSAKEAEEYSHGERGCGRIRAGFRFESAGRFQAVLLKGRLKAAQGRPCYGRQNRYAPARAAMPFRVPLPALA